MPSCGAPTIARKNDELNLDELNRTALNDMLMSARKGAASTSTRRPDGLVQSLPNAHHDTPRTGAGVPERLLQGLR